MTSAVVDAMVWAGTIIFAVTGAIVAIERRFDLIGVLVLGGVTAIGGGSVRDLVVGNVPPPALRNEGLLWAIAATCLVTFLLHRHLRRGRLLYGLDTTSLACLRASAPRLASSPVSGSGARSSPVPSAVSAEG